MKKTSCGRSGVTWPPCGICGNNGREARRGYGSRMGTWYWIGVSAGLGAAIGILLAGAPAARTRGRIAVIVWPELRVPASAS